MVAHSTSPGSRGSTEPIGPIIGGLFSLVNGSVYLLVGREVGRRQLTGAERLANGAFVLWWNALGLLSVVGGILTVFAFLGWRDVALHIVFLNVALAAICIGFWGLSYYLFFVYTGKTVWVWPTALFYGAYVFLALWLVAAIQPNAVNLTRWGVGYGYVRDPQTIPYVREFVLPFLIPIVLAAFAYLTLLLRVREPVQRYRIAMVSGSFLVWFGSSMVASILDVSSDDAWQIASRFISLVAAIFIFVAFRPPAWVMRRLERPARIQESG